MDGKKKRVLAFLLVLTLVFTSGDSYALAGAEIGQETVYQGGLCEHHPEHTAECGYREAMEGSPCTHEHGRECYVQDENGEQILDCRHVHDEECGYQEADEGAPCTYRCEECEEKDSEVQEEEIPIFQWTWADNREKLKEKDGVWMLDLEDSSQEAGIDRETLLKMLPTQIQAEVPSESGEKQEEAGQPQEPEEPGISEDGEILPEGTEEPAEGASEPDMAGSEGEELTGGPEQTEGEGEEPDSRSEFTEKGKESAFQAYQAEDGQESGTDFPASDQKADEETDMESSGGEEGDTQTEEMDTGKEETADTTTELLEITWNMDAFPEEETREGTYVLKAALPEGYLLEEGQEKIQVTVAMGKAAADTKLVLPSGEPAFPEHIVKDGISPVGTTINLFDYWLEEQTKADNKNPTDYRTKGINENHALLFGVGQQNYPNGTLRGEWNKWHKNNPAVPYSGVVEKKLVNGYPKMPGEEELDYWPDQDGHDYVIGESLAYLFNPNTEHSGKKSYQNVGKLLRIDGDGYYYYDCKQNYAVYYEEDNEFVLYDTPAVKKGGGTSDNQFFPFNAADEVLKENDSGELTQLNVTSGDPKMNHYFGMTMTTRFIQKDGGKTEDGKTVTYEFSGDDDVWIFIDDVLVGDLGGIHDASSLKINFATGEIFINGENKGTLKSKFKEAGVNTKRFEGNTFSGDTYHTLKFYYLERGNKDSNMTLKFNLVTIPESSVIKVDQTGKKIENVGFELYGSKENDYSEPQFLAEGKTDENGQFIFMKDDAILSLEAISDEYGYLILKETGPPDGYRSKREYHFYFDGPPGNKVLLSANPWETGAYASSNVTAKTDSIVTIIREDGGQETKSLESGTMFAVVLQYQGEKGGLADKQNWYAVSGEPIDGWKVADNPGMDGILQAARENPHKFIVTPDGAYTTTIQDLPGDVTTYYYMLDEKDRGSKTKYTVGYFYTEAKSIEGAEKSNTWQVVSGELEGSGFERVFSVNLYVPNVKNYLYVQKLNENGEPISDEVGTAVFALYPVDDFSDSYTPDREPWDEQETSDLRKNYEEGIPFDLTGGVMFEGIPNGKYYLVEERAPSGYQKKADPIPVIVDDSGVYVDAGIVDDGVVVNRGVGTVVRSMIQFAADDKIDATLHDIKVTQETAADYEEGPWNLTEGNPLHLQYQSQHRTLEYGPLAEGDPVTWENDVGWSRLSIKQCLEHDEGRNNKQELGEQELRELFSRTVIVSVQNEPVGSLKIAKEVVGSTDQNQKFTFEINLTDADEEPLSGSYPAVKRSEENGEESTIVEVTDGNGTVTLGDGESLLIQDLPAGTRFTVTEQQEPSGADGPGYSTVVSVNGGQASEGASGEGTIIHKATSQVDFRNIFTQPVKAEIKGRKILVGRNIRANDTFTFQITGADEDTKKAIQEGMVALPQDGEVVLEGDGTQSEKEFTFGELTIRAAGEYTFSVEEVLPEGVNSEKPVGSDGIQYDTHKAKVTVTVEEKITGVLEKPIVTYSNEGATSPTDATETSLAAFTNTLQGMFSFKKVDAGDRSLSGAEFVLYELICAEKEHIHNEQIPVEKNGEISEEYEYKACWEKIGVAESGQDGFVNFTHLSPDAREYRLIEYQAPAGYVLPTGQWKVVYDEDAKAFQIADAKGKLGNPPAFKETKGEYQIANYQPGELPLSGNRGIRIFLTVGGTLMLAGGLWYLRIRQKRMQAKR